MKFTKFLRTSVSTEHLPWMLLYLYLTAYYLFLNDPKIISKSKALGILLQLIYYLTNSMRYWRLIIMMLITAWKVSEDGVFSGPYFPTFGLNTERYSVSLRIKSECRKMREKYGPEQIRIRPLIRLCLCCIFIYGLAMSWHRMTGL